MPALIELERAYRRLRREAGFRRELARWLREYAGRPTLLYFADHLSRRLGGARIYLKREDLLHTGAHKINNTIGQALLARRLKKTRLIAETGAGQHGVATATVAALFGMPCEVFMGAEDVRRQSLNVFRMKLLGATVTVVESGSRVQKIADVSVASPAATPSTKALVSASGKGMSSIRSATPAVASVMQAMKRSSTGMLLLFVVPWRLKTTFLYCSHGRPKTS